MSAPLLSPSAVLSSPPNSATSTPSDPFLRFWDSLDDKVLQDNTALLTGDSPPGRLLTLPKGVFILGKITCGRHLYVRACYIKLVQQLEKHFADEERCRGALIVGNPGIGKVGAAAAHTCDVC